MPSLSSHSSGDELITLASLKKLLDSISDIAIVLDNDCTILFSNHQLEEILGYRLEELKKIGVDGFLKIDDLESIAADWKKLTALPSAPIASRYKTAKEVTHPANVCIQSHIAPGIHVLLIEPAPSSLLLNSEGDFGVFDTISQGIVVIKRNDMSMPVVHANTAMSSITSLPREKMIGQPYKSLIDPLGDQSAWVEFATAWQDGTCCAVELVCHLDNGKERTLLVGMSPLCNRAGEIAEFLCIHIDVTSLRIRADQSQLARRMDALGRLAGGIAHDFNNLLTVIRGYAEMLMRRSGIDAATYADAERIHRAAGRAGELTDQLHALSRNKPQQLSEVNLNTIATDLAPLLRRFLGDKIDLSLGLSHDAGLVRADRSQIEQLLILLATAAAESMSEGGRFRLETSRANLNGDYSKTHLGVEPGQYVQLTVTDTGKGVPVGVRDRVFEPFTKELTNSHAGLGLSIGYGIVKQNNGHVWVYSEPGRGTTFKIYLPRLGSVEKTSPLERRTILLVEDEESVREFVRQVLEHSGYRVLTNSTPESAIELFKLDPQAVDLVLTDVIMPGLTGPEMVREMRLLRPALRVIFMSGFTGTATRDPSLVPPGSIFLEKPFGLDRLLQTVGQSLGQIKVQPAE